MTSGHRENDIVSTKHKENDMPRTKGKQSSRKKPTTLKPKRKNIVGNFRGSEDIFWTKVIKGFKKFLESPFK